MTYSTLVSLKLISADGKIEREIVAHGSITVYNLHRVLQFCLTPSKSDATIAATPFTFKHGKKVVKGVKGTKLSSLAGEKEGSTYTYQTGNSSYTVTVTGVKTVPLDEAQYYVPRCVDGSGGNCNLDRVNRKLLVRRFTAAGSSGRAFKQLPALYCDASTTDAELMDSHLNSMADPLF
jgi:hypothetical protein